MSVWELRLGRSDLELGMGKVVFNLGYISLGH